MRTNTNERLISAIHTAAADFINRESNRRSLITVTHVDLAEGDKNARVFVSVFPKEQSHAAIDFLERQKDEFRVFLREHVKFHTLPHVSFLLDPEMGG